MNHNYDAHDYSRQLRSLGDQATDAEALGCEEVAYNSHCASLDNLKRDRFEMLSAYLDGEVTADERRLVDRWLEQDPAVQRLYARLLKLRQGMELLPTPISNAQAVERTIEQVFARLEGTSTQRSTAVVEHNRAEMLSAYLDNEATPEERRQVERWLEQDPALQRLHGQLLKLRQGVQALPVAVSDARSVEQTIDQVFAQVAQRRTKRTFAWGGAAIAAAIIGAVGAIFAGTDGFAPQFAQSPESDSTGSVAAVRDDALMIALDQPIIEIPKVPLSDGESIKSIVPTPKSNVQ